MLMSPAAEIFDVTVVLTQRRAIRCASGSSLSPQDFIFVTLTTFPLASQVVHLPTCLPFSKYPDRILVPSFLNHSQYPVSTSSTVWPLALMVPSL
jgi:hypothetical protein